MQDAATGRPQFDSSAMGCEYHEYRRRDVLQCLARPKGQAALVMIGAHGSGKIVRVQGLGQTSNEVAQQAALVMFGMHGFACCNCWWLMASITSTSRKVTATDDVLGKLLSSGLLL